MEQDKLKVLSNESLLDNLIEYHNCIDRFIKYYTESKDSVSKKYYEEKVTEYTEVYTQLKLEILKRMSGMEID